MANKLKAPFPWFGGKTKVAPLIWQRFGDVNNYIEPFAGSLAVLLQRPHPPRVETVNDLDCYVANFWRATRHEPEAVADYADWPVNETDLHARHRWLVLSEQAAEFRETIRNDPDYYDPRIAGWWGWGICCWIGAGWCAVPGETEGEITVGQNRRPKIACEESAGGVGVHRVPEKLPRLSGDTCCADGPPGAGVHAQPEKRPKLSGGTEGTGSLGCGVHAAGPSFSRLPTMEQCRTGGKMVHGPIPNDTHRPQLADAYARGRGVHGHDEASSCEARRAWLLDWFGRLRDRLRTVRVCCGDWSRVCSSESVTTRLGITGVFLDPPYSKLAGRTSGLYATDSLTVADEVRRWCLEWGMHPAMRIALCGYAGEGHEALEQAGWECIHWKAHGGYGNRSKVGKANAAKERIWFSPHCNAQRSLFDVSPVGDQGP